MKHYSIVKFKSVCYSQISSILLQTGDKRDNKLPYERLLEMTGSKEQVFQIDNFDELIKEQVVDDISSFVCEPAPRKNR